MKKYNIEWMRWALGSLSALGENRMLFNALKKNASNHIETRSNMLLKARKALENNDYDQAAKCYLTHAQGLSDKIHKIDILLRVAHCYEKLNRHSEAANWYLKVAHHYAEMSYDMQALSLLNRYRKLQPDDLHGPHQIIKRLSSNGFWHEDMDVFLSDAERLYYRVKDAVIFSSISSAEVFTETMTYMSLRTIKNGEVLVSLGDHADEMFFVMSGKLEARMTLDNRQDSLGIVKSHELCGEVAYFTGGKRTAELIAREETSLLVISYKHIEKLQCLLANLKTYMETLYRKRILLQQLALAPVFSILDSKSRQYAAQCMTPVELSAGQSLFFEGDPNQAIYLLRLGHMSVNLEIKGNEKPFKTMTRGAVIGELSIINGGHRSATVRALTDCILMMLDAKKYQKLCEASPDLRWLLSVRRQFQLKEIQSFVHAFLKGERMNPNTSLLQSIWHIPE
ncbi:MAG: cyclic nucleotide-binding domain-containing protein [Mariprofundaceae bacterium]|nr:cyclic nucleotide-binding domain-containing protein [Mariprofundaceae bacterium]